MRHCYQGLGFFGPAIAKVVAAQASRPAIPAAGVPAAPIGFTTTSGFAKRPIYATVAKPDLRQTMYDRGVVTPTRIDYSGMIAPQIPEQQLYSKEQLIEMLRRGQSETVERSGESDSGLPIANGLEQKSREGDASRQYAIDAKGATIPVLTQKSDDKLGWLALAAISFLVLGG